MTKRSKPKVRPAGTDHGRPDKPAPAQPQTNSPQPTDAERAGRRRRAVRRRVVRRLGIRGISAIGAVILAGLVALITTLAQTAGNTIVHHSDGEPTATANGSGRGYMAAVNFQYPPGQVFALPRALTDGAQAAQLRAGFTDPVKDMTAFLQTNGGAARNDLNVRLVFTGTSSQPVHILSLQVIIKNLGPNLAGTAIKTSSGSSDETLPVRVDLDTPGRAFTRNGVDYFAGHELNVSSTDWETVDAHFTASKNAYWWLIAVRSVDLSGKSITSYLDSTGHLDDTPSSAPATTWFALSGPATKYQITYADAYGTGGRGFHVATP
ncbi:hypothetical protein [Rugosimonospora africana]|uniref:Uncharacterized protein n=1 Tax=Rugosimonospora africana TaxID=556532 RepID=A0A8J3R1V1_9ACTN|nr:hypothetical protein [Rugosimonospora africana]GIH21450.1 hypothetical protein Raf01_96220 [Rugosimonospora africana]